MQYQSKSFCVLFALLFMFLSSAAWAQDYSDDEDHEQIEELINEEQAPAGTGDYVNSPAPDDEYQLPGDDYPADTEAPADEYPDVLQPELPSDEYPGDLQPDPSFDDQSDSQNLDDFDQDMQELQERDDVDSVTAEEFSSGISAQPAVPAQCSQAAGRVIILLNSQGVTMGATYLKPGARVDFANQTNVTHRITISPPGFFGSDSFIVTPHSKMLVVASSPGQLTGGSIVANPGSSQTVHDVVICP